MQLTRSISKLSLLFVSVGAMIGSGWLFGPLYAAQIAGPAAVFSWAVGGLLVIVVALTFTELSAMLPVTGGIARFPQFTHGPMVSYVMTWLAWIAYVLLPSIEVQALLQYSSNYFPWLMHPVAGKPQLTGIGFASAAGLLLVMSYLNIVGIRFVSRFNTLLVWAKILVPLSTAITLIAVAFHSANFVNHGGFEPYGIKSILVSLPMAGVIFSFFGFRLSIELAGEAKNPQRALPIALIGSLVICILLYTLVQFSFIGAIDPTKLSHGWHHLAFNGDAGPFVGVALGLGLGWLVILLYSDAFFSPFGSALMVVTTTSRLNYAMSVNRYAPKFLQRLNRKGVPHWAILVNFAAGMLLLLPFPGWQKLAGFIISALVISHAIAPVCLIAMRRQMPDLKRPFKLPAATFMSLIAFIILNSIGYWTGWQTMWKMYVAGGVGLVLLAILRLTQGQSRPPLHISRADWLIPYFAGMALFSYFGNFGGGKGVIPFGWDMLGIALFSVAIFFWAVARRLPQDLCRDAVMREQQVTELMGEGEQII